jgi:hypothetical protein
VAVCRVIAYVHRSCFTRYLKEWNRITKTQIRTHGAVSRVFPFVTPGLYPAQPTRATPHVASRRVVGLSARSASSLRENQSEVHPRTFARQARKSPRAHFVDWIAVSRLLIYQTPSSQAEPFPGPDSSFPPSSLSSRAHWVLASLRWLFCQGMRDSVVITEGDTRRAPWRASLRMPISSLLS